jgi:hypothetical protein
MLIRLFRGAGATGHVFFLKSGRVNDKGVAYSGLVGPQTTVAVVPTTPQIVPFAIEAQTADKQAAVVRGTLAVTLAPAAAVRKFDFTVDPVRGGFIGNWSQVLNAKVLEHVVRAVLERVKTLDVETATRSQKAVEDAVRAIDPDVFRRDGIEMDSCSIPKIDPKDQDVASAIGAEERQQRLAQSDRALHERRLKASENDRTVKTYEADTQLELAKKQGELLDEESKNKEKEAKGDAEATRIRLEPLKEIASGRILSAALADAARSGSLGKVTITSDLLAAINDAE